MSKVTTQGMTEIRELSVLLGIADTCSGNGAYELGDIDGEDKRDYGFDVPTHAGEIVGRNGETYHVGKMIDYQPTGDFLDDYDGHGEHDPEVLCNGDAFIDALDGYHIDIPQSGGLQCDCGEWDASARRAAKRNYKLGTFIADYFGLGPGSVERLVWVGPENASGDKRKTMPPADIGIDLVGTPKRFYELIGWRLPEYYASYNGNEDFAEKWAGLRGILEGHATDERR